MENEKRISCKDVIKILLGNKWLYLILVGVVFLASFIGFNLYSYNKKEYIAFFDYDVAGFNTVVNENGEETTYYIDGEKFNPRSLVSKEKFRKYFSENPELNDLDVESLFKKNIVKSFDYKIRYVKNDHRMDEKDAAYVANKKGYELVLNSYGISEEQARVISNAVANEVLAITSNKLEKLNYEKYINGFKNADNYPEKIDNLVKGIDYIIEYTDILEETYGDAIIHAGKYGGEDDKYILSDQTISDWKNQVVMKFDSYRINSLSNELEVNGYICSDSTTYIVSLETAVENLNREIAVNEAVLTDLKTQRDALVSSVGSGATIESVEIREYNTEIIALTKKIAEQKEQVNLNQLQLEKLDTSSFSPDQLAEYNTNLNIFDTKLSSAINDLEFYTLQYESIAKTIMKDNMNVYFDDGEVVKLNGGLSPLVSIAASAVIAIVAPMILNLLFFSFSLAEGKSLLNFKNGNK